MTCIARLGHGCGSAAAVAATSATPAMALHKARYIVICTSLDLPEHTAATRSSERTSLALRPLQHRVEELEPLLLQIAQHVFGDGWKGLPDQDVEPERRQRSALERFASRHLLLQGLRSRVLPRDDPETDALERGAGRLWRGQKADAFVIGPGRRVIRLAAGAGGDLLERETPAGHQHAVHLAVEAIAIGDVHCRILRPHDIEARVGEWQIERVALSIGDLVGEPRALREHRGERDEFRREIEAGHLAAELAREVARRPAHAAADVENPVGAVDVRKLRQPYGRISPARMELIDRREIVGREMLDVFPCRFERRQDDVAQRASLVMLGDCLRRSRHVARGRADQKFASSRGFDAAAADPFGRSNMPLGRVSKKASTSDVFTTSAYLAFMSHRLMAWLACDRSKQASSGSAMR